jgi:hypothetical protein
MNPPEQRYENFEVSFDGHPSFRQWMQRIGVVVEKYYIPRIVLTWRL